MEAEADAVVTATGRAYERGRREALEEAVRAVQRLRLKCEFFPVGRSRGVPMLSPRDAKDQVAAALRALAR